MEEEKILNKVRDYFHKEAQDYDEYWKEKPKFKSPFRWLANRFYRDKTFQRLEAVITLAGEVKATTKVLEVGSGGGQYAMAFAEKGADVLGIDFAPRMVELAEKVAQAKGIGGRCKFKVCNILDFEGSKEFDIVYAAGVLDYIPSHLRVPVLQRMAQLARGKVIFSYPKKGTIHSKVRKAWLSYKDVPVYFYSKADILSLAEKAGLILEDSRDIGTLVVQCCRPKI